MLGPEGTKVKQRTGPESVYNGARDAQAVVTLWKLSRGGWVRLGHAGAAARSRPCLCL